PGSARSVSAHEAVAPVGPTSFSSRPSPAPAEVLLIDAKSHLASEEPDRLLPSLRREGEGVMQAAVLLRGPVELLLALAKQDIVVAHVEARHVGVAQPPAIFETEQVAVEALALLQIVDRDGPVGDAVDLEHILTSVRVSGAARFYCGAG